MNNIFTELQTEDKNCNPELKLQVKGQAFLLERLLNDSVYKTAAGAIGSDGLEDKKKKKRKKSGPAAKLNECAAWSRLSAIVF